MPDPVNEFETPAEPQGGDVPKGAPAGERSSPGDASTATPSASSGANGSPAPSAPSAASSSQSSPPPKTKAELDFEQRMQALGERDLKLKQEADAIAADRQRLAKYKAALDAIESGDDVRIAEAVYGKRLNIDLLTKLANHPVVSAPPRPLDEDGVKRILEQREAEAREKAAADARAKADEEARAAQARVDQETAAYLAECDQTLVEKAAELPFVSAFLKTAEKAGNAGAAKKQLYTAVTEVIDEAYQASIKAGKPSVMEPLEALKVIEERNRSVFEETPYAPPKRPRAPTFEDEIAEMSRTASIPRSPKAPPRTLDEQIMEDLRRGDEAQLQQQRRFSR